MRFFFHIRDGGVLVPDDEGMELSDMRAAHAQAVLSSNDLILEGANDKSGHSFTEVELDR
jgi:uncharacterized protein DUF6894